MRLRKATDKKSSKTELIKTSKKMLDTHHKQLSTMNKKIDKTYSKLSKDIKKKANLKTIQKDSNELLLLLGECDYLVNELKKEKKLR